MATYLHSNDKRKVVNALFKRLKNLALSDEETKADQLQQRLALRFKPIILWIMADKAVLEQRIRKRVDKMIDQEDGLAEIFHVFDAFT